MHIKLTKQIFSTLNRPDNPCAETVPEISYTECLERCRWELIAHQVNCCLPFMDVPGYEICTDEDPALTAMNYYRSWTDSVSKDQCRAKCVRPCNIKLYSTQITSQLKISDRLSRFHIFFQSGVVQVINCRAIMMNINLYTVFRTCMRAGGTILPFSLLILVDHWDFFWVSPS